MSYLSNIDTGILKFCLEHNDSPNLKESLPERDPRDFEWLKKVMASVKSDAERLRLCNETLTDELSTISDKARALDEILFIVEDLDNANDYCKMGLGELAISMSYGIGEEYENKKNNNNNNDEEDQSNLGVEDEGEIRAGACFILSTLAQNNEFSQKQILDQKIFHILLKLLEDEEVDKVIIKGLSALSAMIRGNEDAKTIFKENNGLKNLNRLLSTSENCSIRTKVIVTLKHLVIENINLVIDTILEEEYLNIILSNVSNENQGLNDSENNETLREQTLLFLISLFEHQDEIKQKKINIKNILSETSLKEKLQDQLNNNEIEDLEKDLLSQLLSRL